MKKVRVTEALRRSYRIFNAEFSLKRSGLSLPQMAILAELDDGPVKQARVGDLIAMDRTTLSRIVRTMCFNQLVTSEAAPDDARADILTITEKGRKAMLKADGALAAAEAPLMRRITPVDRLAFLRVLRAIVGELQ